jgi:hypothetical protein
VHQLLTDSFGLQLAGRSFCDSKLQKRAPNRAFCELFVLESKDNSIKLFID